MWLNDHHTSLVSHDPFAAHHPDLTNWLVDHAGTRGAILPTDQLLYLQGGADDFDICTRGETYLDCEFIR